MPNLKDMNW